MTKTYEIKVFVHLYDGIKTTVHEQTHTVDAVNEHEAEKKLYADITKRYKSSPLFGLSSITIIETKELPKENETHGKWTRETVWIYRNDRGDIMRAQDEHPAAASEEVEKIYRSDAHESNHERL